MPEPIVNLPALARGALGEPSLNVIVSAAGTTAGTIIVSDHRDGVGLLSLAEVDGSGDNVIPPVATCTIALQRSIDGGYSYQHYKSYTASAEETIPYMAGGGVSWRFVITAVQSTKNFRIRLLGLKST